MAVYSYSRPDVDRRGRSMNKCGTCQGGVCHAVVAAEPDYAFEHWASIINYADSTFTKTGDEKNPNYVL